MSNTTSLINKVKLWAAVPSSQPAFSVANLLVLMTDELRTNIAPLLMSCMEEFYVVYQDFTISSSTTSFNIPARAIGLKLRDVKIVDGSGTETDVPRINPDHSQSHNFGFYMRGNKIFFLSPGDYATYSLRLYYYTRPSTLIETTAAATITTVGTDTLVVSSVPSTWTSPMTVDVVQATSPYGLIGTSVTSTWTGTTFTLSVPADTAVGDYICIQEESPVPFLPEEWHSLLTQAVVIRVMEALLDKKGLEVSLRRFDDMKQKAFDIISPRIDGELARINPYESFLDGPSI